MNLILPHMNLILHLAHLRAHKFPPFHLRNFPPNFIQFYHQPNIEEAVNGIHASPGKFADLVQPILHESGEVVPDLQTEQPETNEECFH